MKLGLLCALTLLFFLGGSSAYAEDLNAGFVEGLWYAHKPLVAGKPTRIYVALRNNSESDLTGIVKFTDNGVRIGTANVSALPGRIVEAWVDWTPGYGNHTVLASLTDVEVHDVGETPERSTVSDTLAEDALFADYDTDNDGILNEQDPDDDNDTMSDAAEIAAKRNPLKADPIPKTETQETTPPKNTPITETPAPQTNTALASGLENYLPEGKTQTLVRGLTETISETKETLDTYRTKQSDDLKPYFSSSSTVSSPTPQGATITRSYVQKDESFFEAVVRGGKALLGGVYRVLLSAASQLLAHPAFLEILLLLGLMYFFYRTARRLGRRRNN